VASSRALLLLDIVCMGKGLVPPFRKGGLGGILLGGEAPLRTAAIVSGIVFLSLMISPVVSGQNVQLSIPASSGAIGAEVSIPVNIGDTTGREIIAAEITIQYDTQALSATDATVLGTIADGWLIFPNTATPGEISVYMAGANVLSGSGTFVNLHFVVQSTAQVGGMYPLNFTRALLNEGDPGVVSQGGTFIPEPGGEPERIPGDANGDDRVNHLDLLKLILSYGKNSGDAGYDPDADLNDDGNVNKDDVIILWKNFGASKQ